MKRDIVGGLLLWFMAALVCARMALDGVPISVAAPVGVVVAYLWGCLWAFFGSCAGGWPRSPFRTILRGMLFMKEADHV